MTTNEFDHAPKNNAIEMDASMQAVVARWRSILVSYLPAGASRFDMIVRGAEAEKRTQAVKRMAASIARGCIHHSGCPLRPTYWLAIPPHSRNKKAVTPSRKES
jgi:hypothetical protein